MRAAYITQMASNDSQTVCCSAKLVAYAMTSSTITKKCSLVTQAAFININTPPTR